MQESGETSRSGQQEAGCCCQHWAAADGREECIASLPDGVPRAASRKQVRLPGGATLPRGCVIATVAGLCVCVGIFVGWDVFTRYAMPNLSTAWRHALLTACAALVTAITSGTVYHVVHRQQVRLSKTAQRLAELIKSCHTNPSNPGRFENPHLVHCRQLTDCAHADCPMHDAEGQRCWEVMALGRASQDHVPLRVEIERCLQCPVYRLSCPDPITELGESFNSLMFLLEKERQRAGRMHALMVEKEKMVAIGQMAAGVAHEVCNPLSSISSVVQMLKRRQAGSASTAQLDLIETHIQRITGIVRKLTALSHPGVDHWASIDVGATLEEVVRLISFDPRARCVDIDWTPPPAPLKTCAVRDQLQQVFINLALNALDAMPDGGRLAIRAEQDNRHIRVIMADTGCGIPPEIGRRVFDPFFTTKPQGQGTGLGLAVSYGIIQKHGGLLDFSSSNGNGTVFTVQIPVLSAPPDS